MRDKSKDGSETCARRTHLKSELVVCSRILEVRSDWSQEVGDEKRRQEEEGRKQKAGGQKQEAGGKRVAGGEKYRRRAKDEDTA